MASNLATIYSQLDATTVTVNGVTPTVYSLSELKQSADTAHLPMRLLLPTDRRARATSWRHDVFTAAAAEVTWVLTDLCLWRPANQGIGIKDVASDLADYMRLYADMLVSFSPGNGANVSVTNAELIIDRFEWPELSDRWFWGVEAVLTITENI